MNLKGVDISCYQGSIDFGELRASDYGNFVYAKATEGLEYVDEKFRSYHNGAKLAGIPFGAYHFYHFGVDPIEQAQHFLKTIDGYGGTLLPMFDVEDGSLWHGFNPIAGAHDLNVFASEVGRVLFESKRGPILYTGYSFWQDSMNGTASVHSPLWVAEYNKQSAPSLPTGFSSWALWQYSSSGTVPGISGNVDLDVLNGNNLQIITR